MVADWTLGFGLVLTAAVAAFLGLFLNSYLARPAAQDFSGIFTVHETGTVFLFDGESLIDGTPGARALLASSHIRSAPWGKLMSYLAPYFPDLGASLMRLPHEGVLTLASEGATNPLLLQAELRGGLTRLVLIDPEQDDCLPGQDPMVHRATVEELDLLRQAVSQTPTLIWREKADGEVTWANAAYMLRVADRLEPGQDLSWPLPRLFERTASAQGVAGQRQKLTLRDGRAAWFELFGTTAGEGRLVFALPADATVTAENALKEFMQTLTKTFAHLHVGLAIFDRQRQLQLFNPALLDLTGLPADFLSMRPSLLSVLDGMRDRNMIPEPKDYRGWRRQMIDMEKAASSGLYEETWSLPGGQTYRVIGRPHPNGALALIIEDISGEMLRTRRYRADLELGQSVIDGIDEAIAVFSQAGQLVMSNTAYTELWDHDPSATLGDASLRALCDQWRCLSAPGRVWEDLEDFASNPGDRYAWRAEARLLDGRLVSCRFAPLAAGATLAAFRVAPAAGPSIELPADEAALLIA